MPDFEANLSKLAEILTGRRCVVRLQPPTIQGLKGEFTRGQYVAVIDILPTLGNSEMFYIFLHECAHVKLHWDTIRATPNLAQPPAVMPYQEAIKAGEILAAGTDPRETEADNQAKEWQSNPDLQKLWFYYTH